MRGRLQQSSSQLVGLLATIIYLLTMDRSASWWDCGEFIATGYLLQVGHPPGAPTYQLLQHLFTLLSFGNQLLVAPLSNALSAIAAGITVGLLYGTIRLLLHQSNGRFHWGPAIGALCYLFCDTAWFSAVESEVYALAMLFCSLDLYLMLRWHDNGNHRLLLLLGLLIGLGVGVHLMTLLVVPALLPILIKGIAANRSSMRPSHVATTAIAALLFCALGLSTHLIIPIRAAANPPINEGNPSTTEAFHAYLARDQYAKAPHYPRMWRQRDADNWNWWVEDADPTSFVDNAVYYASYQLGYMYLRYLMYNFGGRENMKWNSIVLFILPALLGLYGLWQHRRRNRTGFWSVLLLFLFGGIILNLYLNHPCYEPRERDYAYVLSFYAFAIWIGVGADSVAAKIRKAWPALLLLAPLTMAVGNWSDHDRSRCHSVHDIALNHLQSCDPDAVLITLGDNDTFPLWYLQQVEGQRTDISIYNVGLTGFAKTINIINESIDHRPIYLSQYFYDRYARLFEGQLRCEGFCWRLLPDGEDIDDPEPLQRHLRDSIRWHITDGEYLDNVSRRFLDVWHKNTAR